MITTEQVKELRDKTGISIMQCKKALEEVNGDMEKALMILKKKSSEVASKKADREAADGTIVIAQATGKAALVELNCETDFVAKNEDFVTLANQMAQKALTDGVDGLKAASDEMIAPVIQKIGENIKVGDMEVLDGETVGGYTHNGKAGAIVVLTGGTPEIAKDIAMQIVAMRPEFIQKSDIPAETTERATELFKKEIDESGKPEEIKQKMLEGKISSYFKDLTLMDQPFFKNPDQTIGDLLAKNGATFVRHSYKKIG
jgi:elongation factor Ts